MASTSINRAFSSSSTNTKATWSFWIKRNKLGVEQWIFQTRDANSNNYRTYIRFSGADLLDMRIYNTNGTLVGRLQTNRVFRDTNAWYHIVYRMDTTQGNAGDRLRLYINGVEEISFGTDTQMANGQQVRVVSSVNTCWGRSAPNNSEYFDGLLSHINFIEGEDRTPDFFGETDTTTGEWKIKTNPTGFTYGSNGYFILKDGNSVTDASTNSNNFTVAGGTLTKTEDCPSNVFATMNALSKGSDAVLSKGSTILRNDQNTNANVLGTIALGNGKYYWETYKHGGGLTGLGLTLASIDGSNHAAIHSYRVNYYQDGYIYQNGFGLSDINTGVTYADTDIIGISVDTENGTIKFYKNGALVNNSSQTNSVFTLAQNELIPFWYVNNGGEWRTNLGNGYFGTTAITSAGTNASGNGIFEYDVQPTDATALSTKGLNL